MKVLYIDVNYKHSSTGNIVYNMHKYNEKNNIESAVCYGRGPLIKEENVYKFGIDIETCIHALLTRITGFTGCYSYFSTKRLLKYIKKFNPNVVHVHELHAYFVNIKQLLMYLKNNNIPTIFTNHCEFIYTGKCGHSKDCNKYTNKCGNCPYNKDYPKSLFFDHTKFMLKQKKKIFDGWDNTFFVSPSKWLDKKINNSILHNKRKKVILNSIDTNIFRYKNTKNKKNNIKTIISVAPNIFSKNKGGFRILELAKLMIDYHFILVGDTIGYKTKLNNVTIHPTICNKNELNKLYSSSDCCLIVSENENFPSTSIEAQCSGTKIAAYDVGGVKETIIGDNGIVVPFNDIKGIINAIKTITTENYNKELVSKMAINEYYFDKMYKEYLKIYKILCQS